MSAQLGLWVGFGLNLIQPTETLMDRDKRWKQWETVIGRSIPVYPIWITIYGIGMEQE